MLKSPSVVSPCSRYSLLLVAAVLTSSVSPVTAADAVGKITASGTAAGTRPIGVMDGDRFSLTKNSLWKCNNTRGWWQIEFAKPRRVGSILQINGDHEFRFTNAPRNYIWQWSNDGKTWYDLLGTLTRREKRMYRIHRLAKAREVRFLRLKISLQEGQLPALREVEFYAETDAKIPFDDWIIAINNTENPHAYGAGMRFATLARQCKGWEDVHAQWMYHGDFDEQFVAAEPRPLCAFLSGSSLDWSQRSREPYRGLQQVLKNRNLPMWAACGGAQVLAILEDTGFAKEWDCPRCRDPKNPKLPIYTHIGHNGYTPLGDYSKNVGERGKFKMKKVAIDPVFEGLPEIFEIMESHIGQITYPPKGWVRVVTKGPGAHTVNQCIRVKDRYIYAAQFHMEMAGTPENSQIIMANFLRLAKEWGGYSRKGKAVPLPGSLASSNTPARSSAKK